MSEQTDHALVKIDALLTSLQTLPAGPARDQIVEETEALRRATAAFHMEAIRFRMYNVDRNIKLGGDPASSRALFEQVRQALEAAGFHTRSHTAP